MFTASPGVLESVNFTLHPAIRAGQPNISGCSSNTWECPDEDCGCPHTTWLLCGLHATELTQAQQLSVLACWDQANIQYSPEWTLPTPQEAVLSCVNQTIPSAFEAVSACGNGTLGEDLKSEAADYFHATFPDRWTGPIFSVPNVYINNVQQEVNLDGSDLWEFANSICNAGADAALCGGLSVSI